MTPKRVQNLKATIYHNKVCITIYVFVLCPVKLNIFKSVNKEMSNNNQLKLDMGNQFT